MDLELDAGLGEAYKSRSQAARKITEGWGTKNLFCLSCPSDLLISETANTPVRDYTCPRCSATYQLKSKNGSFGKVVQNSAYQPKLAAIANGGVPHYAFLQYSRVTWSVTDLFVVPGHLISAGVIQKRNPLKKGARREGWVGSNILLGQLPGDARIPIISQGFVREPSRVRDDWRRYIFFCKRISGAEVDGEPISFPVSISFNEKQGIGSSRFALSTIVSLKKLHRGTRITTTLKPRYDSNFKSCVMAACFGSSGVADIKLCRNVSAFAIFDYRSASPIWDTATLVITFSFRYWGLT